MAPIPLTDRIATKEQIRLVGKTSNRIALIFVVMGAIFSIVTKPLQAARIGTFSAFIVAAIHRKLDWPTIPAACQTALKGSAVVIWIISDATIYVGLQVLEAGQQFVQDSLATRRRGPWVYRS